LREAHQGGAHEKNCEVPANEQIQFGHT